MALAIPHTPSRGGLLPGTFFFCNVRLQVDSVAM